MQPGDNTIVVRLPASPQSVTIARRMLSAGLTASGVAKSVIDDAKLVVTELVSNGLEHGTLGEDGHIEVCWCVHDDCLEVSVTDAGTVETLHPLPLNEHAPRGRGLAIVDYVCDTWRVSQDGGTRITAELSLH